MHRGLRRNRGPFVVSCGNYHYTRKTVVIPGTSQSRPRNTRASERDVMEKIPGPRSGSRVHTLISLHTKKQKRDQKEEGLVRSRDEILETLGRLNPELRSTFKVRRIGLFGSFARQEQRPDSDIDLLVDFSEDADLFDLIELKYFLEDRLGHRVDIVPERALRDELRQSVHADVCYV